MVEDPRRGIVEVMARLGRETQLHLDERYRHFRITDAVIIAVSLVLVVLAVFNVYYVRVLYEDLDGIVDNMESMHDQLKHIDEDMIAITQRFARFDQDMEHMDPIAAHISSLTKTVPRMGTNIDEMSGDMHIIEGEMGLVRRAMVNIDQRLHHMGGGVGIMRQNTRQLAAPMGAMNPMLP